MYSAKYTRTSLFRVMIPPVRYAAAVLLHARQRSFFYDTLLSLVSDRNDSKPGPIHYPSSGEPFRFLLSIRV